MVGTAGNPANPTLGTLAAWQRLRRAANTVGAAFRAAGIKYFFHPEQDWFRFFDDPAHPELARVHRIDWFTDNTDPKLVFFEPDTMHTLAGAGASPTPSTAGSSTSTPGTAGSRRTTGSSPGTSRTPTGSSRCRRPGSGMTRMTSFTCHAICRPSFSRRQYQASTSNRRPYTGPGWRAPQASVCTVSGSKYTSLGSVLSVNL